MAEIETIWPAVLHWDGQTVQVRELGAHRTLTPYADNTHTAIDLLRRGHQCRMNVSDSIIREIREHFWRHAFA